MFWDGKRWVPEKHPVVRSRPPASPNRHRSWLATVPILLLVPALLVPFFATNAAGPVITLSPNAAPAATSIKVTGSDFPRGASGSLTWDDGTTLGTFKVRGNGEIQVTVAIPKGASVGSHTVAATGGPSGASTPAQAQAVETVLGATAPIPTPTPVATPAPTPTPTPTPTPVATPAPTPTPTPTPVATPAPTPTPTPTPVATPAPTPAPTPTPSSGTLRVTSVPALLSALADNSITEVVVANGTYRVSPAFSHGSDSLWIGARFAGRTRPITVRAETRGGVTFDGGGATYFGGMVFLEGAHDQIWDGFNFANGEATKMGIVNFGASYTGLAAPHHITMRYITILPSCTGNATSASAPATDHAFYFSQAVGGPHDILLEDITVDGRGFLASAVHFDHSTATERNAWNVTVRRLHVTGTQQAIILWTPPLGNITFDTADIRDTIRYAVRYESVGSTGIVFANIISTGSGEQGFYSSQGTAPAGVTFSNNSLR